MVVVNVEVVETSVESVRLRDSSMDSVGVILTGTFIVSLLGVVDIAVEVVAVVVVLVAVVVLVVVAAVVVVVVVVRHPPGGVTEVRSCWNSCWQRIQTF